MRKNKEIVLRWLFICNSVFLMACYWALDIVEPAEDYDLFLLDVFFVVAGVLFVGFFLWLFLIHNYKKE